MTKSLNGYKAFYKQYKMDVYASSSYQAQTIAATAFKARKQHEVTVVLCEKASGEQVTHSTAMIG